MFKRIDMLVQVEITSLLVTSRLLKKTHILRCARSSRYHVRAKYASARRFFARLGSEIFLSSLQPGFFITLLVAGISFPIWNTNRHD
jgi:hypothetical protein